MLILGDNPGNRITDAYADEWYPRQRMFTVLLNGNGVKSVGNNFLLSEMRLEMRNLAVKQNPRWRPVAFEEGTMKCIFFVDVV